MMLNYPFESTKYSGSIITYPAFSGWSTYAGVRCRANAGEITASHSFPYYGQQGAGASTSFDNLNSGIVEFSFTLASTYNAGAAQVTGSLSISLWDNLLITSDSVSIIPENGSRQTIISGLNIRSYIGNPRRVHLRASSSELLLTIDGREHRAVYEPLKNLTNNISFNVGCYAYYNGVHFASNTTIYAPGSIKITT